MNYKKKNSDATLPHTITIPKSCWRNSPASWTKVLKIFLSISEAPGSKDPKVLTPKGIISAIFEIVSYFRIFLSTFSVISLVSNILRDLLRLMNVPHFLILTIHFFIQLCIIFFSLRDGSSLKCRSCRNFPIFLYNSN